MHETTYELYNPIVLNSIDGFFNVIKPAGITSFDVIRHIRPLLGKRVKVGHAGVIDKPAVGVLPIGVGRATRLFDALSDFTKDYYSYIAFGVNTPTLDFSSEMSQVAPPHSFEQAALLAATLVELSSRFIGDIEQIPPAYSNVKVDGRELYKYVINAEKVELKPRVVRINRFEILKFHYYYGKDTRVVSENSSPPKTHNEFDLPKLQLFVDADVSIPILFAEVFIECETGTYVRAIARDLGESAKCGGVVAKLMRTRVGPFKFNQAVDLETLTDALRSNLESAVSDYLYPMSSVIRNNHKIVLYLEEAQVLANGLPVFVQSVRLPKEVTDSDCGQSQIYAVLEDGRLIASCLTCERQTQPDIWVVRPDKVFLK